MALQVFAPNPAAQALYESVGYRVSSFNMIKPFA
jgi:predicted GNAT family acetyltransferase